MRRLTTAEYWDETYMTASDAAVDLADVRQLGVRLVIEVIEDVIARVVPEPAQVLEVGAGNSAVLCHLAGQHPRSAFTGMDYAARGCARLRERAVREGVTIDVHQGDLFQPEPGLHGAFGLVYSLGLLEHFTDLPAAVAATSQFVRPGGVVVTVIPNLAGVLGRLVRRFAPDVYALHVPHDLPSLIRGHEAGGLTVVQAAYLGAINFGVLSACFREPGGRGWTMYRWLSRLTTACWWFESRVMRLPASRLLSPYLYVVGHRGHGPMARLGVD